MSQNLRPVLASKQAAKLKFRLRAAQLLCLPESELAELIARVEREPLFERIRGFIRRQPFPMRRFHLLGPQEQQRLSAGGSIPWAGHERQVELIRRMGSEAFEQHFLYQDTVLPPEAVAERCGVTPQEVQDIRDFLDRMAIQAPEPPPPLAGPAPRRGQACVAKVEVSGGEPQLAWMLPHLARGRYGIDYEKLQGFRRTDLGAGQNKELRKLLGTLELINLRQNTLWRMLQLVLLRQAGYLKTGRPADRVPLLLVRVAAELGLHPSTMGRMVESRSLLAPWERELPLRFLFPNRREIVICLLRELAGEGARRTDEDLRRLVKEKAGIELSRRSINECRLAAEASP